MSRIRPAVLLPALAAVTLGLTACGPGTATLNAGQVAAESAPATTVTESSTVTAAAPSAATVTATVVTRSAPVVSSGTGGAGSFTMALTSPRAVSGHVDATVQCTPARVYHAGATGVVQGYTVHFGASAVGYHGAGSYPATLTGSVLAPDGESFALVGLHATASLTDTGGSLPFSATGSRGHTLAGSFSWTCS